MVSQPQFRNIAGYNVLYGVGQRKSTPARFSVGTLEPGVTLSNLVAGTTYLLVVTVTTPRAMEEERLPREAVYTVPAGPGGAARRVGATPLSVPPGRFFSFNRGTAESAPNSPWKASVDW